MTRPGVVGPPERSGECASEAVVDAIAEAGDTDPMSLPPLYDVIEPDGLNSLAASADESDLLISFEYAGYDVRVTGPTSVTVSVIDD